jgi:hypothetical protein
MGGGGVKTFLVGRQVSHGGRKIKTLLWRSHSPTDCVGEGGGLHCGGGGWLEGIFASLLAIKSTLVHMSFKILMLQTCQ